MKIILALCFILSLGYCYAGELKGCNDMINRITRLLTIGGSADLSNGE